MNESIYLCTAAWLLRGVSSIPGELKFKAGSLSFTAFGCGNFWGAQLRKLESEVGQEGLAKQLDRQKEAVVFDVPLLEVHDVNFPWYYFSGGVKLTVNGIRYRFGFDRPANTMMPRQINVVDNVTEVSKARRSGKAWKKLLLNPLIIDPDHINS